MTLFENFYQDLLELVEKYKSLNTSLKIEEDLENNIVKVFGEKITPLARAQNGLSDVTELAYTTAEHHPYWGLIYNCAEITNSVLEKWNGQLTEDDFADIDWSLKEINQTLEKVKTKNSSNS